ncbi:sodium:calcium antiporter [bacterium]|jgi:cation:H+ antiporter|nr:sodium:calcium antiporter [bacterium]MBT5015429.1 sodium:calcium antiporter [bacterium]
MIYSDIVLLVVGLGLLWWAGELTVKYALEMAHMFGFSMLFMGFIVISVSTGLPELAIAIASIYTGVHSLSVGAILGSNFSDIALVLGAPAFFIQTLCIGAEEYKESVFILGLSAAVMAFVFLWGELHWWSGILLILVYIGALITVWQLRRIRDAAHSYVEKELKPEYEPHEAGWSYKLWIIIKLLLSALVVWLGSHLSVSSTVRLAEFLPWSIETLGETIMAIGTSLPELAIAIIAARRKQYSLAIGTSFGSVLEQGTLILGILALFSGNTIVIANFRHIAPFMFIAFAIVGYGIIRREKINRKEGGALLTLYIVFLAYEFFYKV